MKKISPIISALLITAVIGVVILVIGVSALTNPNSTALQDSPSINSVAGNSNPLSTSSDIQQLTLEVNDLQSQLDQANLAIQQYQSLLLALQQRGVIQISRDGRIFLPQDN
jgi:TolA-binding protein